MSPRTGTAHPELGASTEATRMRPAEPAIVAGVVVIAISFRLKTSVMVERDLQLD
jgi:formate hydrogenlyase subunit 4